MVRGVNMFTLLVWFVSCVMLSGALKILDDIPNLYPTGLNEGEKITGGEYPECNEPNEELNLCVQPCGGEDSCYDRDSYACPDVIQSCIPACVCKEGFIRKTLFRECIPKEQCGGPCEIFTQYTDCKQSSKESCSSITNPPKPEDAEGCQPGCTCWPGYHRENDTALCEHRCLCPGMRESPDCETWRRVYE